MSNVVARIEHIAAAAYTIPTDAPEADGTLAWDSTTLIVVEVSAAGQTGLGYTYCNAAAADVAASALTPELLGHDAFAIEKAWHMMAVKVRNMGRPGIASCAISALDIALWDLKARCLNLPLVVLLGPMREQVPAYGSGGFTSYDDARLSDQLSAWVGQGCTAVKMKVGSAPDRDGARVTAARKAIGDQAELFVDANGAYRRKQALSLAKVFSGCGVSWFEEPISSDDLEGLRLLRDHAPAGMDIAAGEYGYTPFYFRRMLEAGAVDVLQADATRCGGITGFLRAGALCDAFGLPLSTHCGPSIHLAVACAVPRLAHMEWFHDHVRIEQMLFDGAPQLEGGHLAPDFSQPGHGLTFRRADAARFAVSS